MLLHHAWLPETVRVILHNREYTGATVTGKTEKKQKSKATKKRRKTDAERWVITEGTHEALIDKETFDTVQQMLRGRKHAPLTGQVDKYANLLYCPDCGKRMYVMWTTTEHKARYVCSTYQRDGRPSCSSHSVGEKALDTVVLTVIRRATREVREHPDEFIRLALSAMNADDDKQYTDITELTPEILNAFVERITVHENPDKGQRGADGKVIGNRVEIVLKCGMKV